MALLARIGSGLEVLDVDLVKAQERGLKGAQFDTIFGAFILVLVDVLAISAGAFDCFGKVSMAVPPEAKE